MRWNTGRAEAEEATRGEAMISLLVFFVVFVLSVVGLFFKTKEIRS